MPLPDASQRLRAIIQTQTEVAKLGVDLGAIMALVTERAQALTGSGGAVLELAEGEDMVYTAASGMAASHLGLRLKRDHSFSGLCVKTGKALRCEDSESDDRVDRLACRRVGLRSMIVQPLVHEGRSVGALKVLGRQPNAFTDEDLETLALVTEMIAASIHHATVQQENELFYRATHDAMTGLANRALFYDRLRQSLAQAVRSHTQIAVVNLDMDGLKPINDAHGHKAGDDALKTLAGRISLGARETDTIARLGGDEFAMVLAPVQDAEGARTRLERVAEQVGRPYWYDGQQLPFGASMGCAVFPQDGKDLATLVEKADHAMYEAKRARKAAP